VDNDEENERNVNIGEIDEVTTQSHKGDFRKSATFKSQSVIENEESNKYNDNSNMKSNFSSNTNFFESKLNFQKNQKNQINDESVNEDSQRKSDNLTNKKRIEIKTTSDNRDDNFEEEAFTSNRNYSSNNKMYEQASAKSSNRYFHKQTSGEMNYNEVYDDSVGTMNFSSNRKFHGSSEQYRQGNYSKDASNRTSNDFNLEDLKNKLHFLEQNKQISLKNLGQGQMLINFNNYGETLKDSTNNNHMDSEENRKSISSKSFKVNTTSGKFSKDNSKIGSSNNFNKTSMS
jgi:hypothetical protein